MIGTYSIEVEFPSCVCYGVRPLFFGALWRVFWCVCRVISEAMLLTPDTHSV